MYHVLTEVSGQLQSHCHWLLEMAIVIVSAIAEGEAYVVRSMSELHIPVTHVIPSQNALLGRSVGGVAMDTDETTEGASDEVYTEYT